MTIHIGLIGGGNITGTHARAAVAIPGAEVVAFYGANPEKIKQLCSQFGGKVYADLNRYKWCGQFPIRRAIL